MRLRAWRTPDINDIIDIVASILIRNLPESTKQALRRRAAENRRSMEEEARQIIDLELRRDRSLERVGLGTWLVKLFDGQELEVPPREGGMRKPPFLTDEEWEKP